MFYTVTVLFLCRSIKMHRGNFKTGFLGNLFKKYLSSPNLVKHDFTPKNSDIDKLEMK